MAEPDRDIHDVEEISDLLYVLKLGDCYSYKLPGFSVLTVKLRHARVQKMTLMDP